jgi:hypothetical protein
MLEVGVGVAVWVWPEPTLLVIAAFIELKNLPDRLDSVDREFTARSISEPPARASQVR